MSRIVVAGLFLATFAGSTVAQSPITNVQATFSSGRVAPDPGVISSGPTGGAYYVGPYSGTLQLGATTVPVIFNCVDFFHDVSAGQSWTTNLVNLGSGDGIGTTNANSLTRLYGNATIGSMSFSALDVYRAAAYLTSLYPAAPSANAALTIAIQTEIWQLTSMFYPQTQGEASTFLQLDPTPGIADGNGTRRTDGYSFSAPKTIAELASDILNYSNQANFDYSQYWVVTSANPNSNLSTSAQEFIVKTTATPEPGTMMLLGSGMLSLFGGGFARRRRAKAAEPEPQVA